MAVRAGKWKVELLQGLHQIQPRCISLQRSITEVEIDVIVTAFGKLPNSIAHWPAQDLQLPFARILAQKFFQRATLIIQNTNPHSALIGPGPAGVAGGGSALRGIGDQ